MSDAAFRKHEDKRETSRIEATQKQAPERCAADGDARPRAARREGIPAGAARGGAQSREDLPGRNLAAKRAMAADLIGMGFSEAQACRVLHISRKERRGTR